MIQDARSQITPVDLKAAAADTWQEAVKTVVAKHPEARHYVELRQKWQELRIRGKTSPSNSELEEKENNALAKMIGAFSKLPLEMKLMLVL